MGAATIVYLAVKKAPDASETQSDFPQKTSAAGKIAAAATTAVPPAKVEKKAPADEAIALLKQELNAQLVGGTCDTCWLGVADRSKFKRLQEYVVESTSQCSEHTFAVRFRCLGENDFGATLWNTWHAVVSRCDGTQLAEWKIANFSDHEILRGCAADDVFELSKCSARRDR